MSIHPITSPASGSPATGRRRNGIAFLLNWTPRSWATREDMFLHLCMALTARHVLPVLVPARHVPPNIRARYLAAGTVVEPFDYGRGIVHTAHMLRPLFHEYGVRTVHIRFFNHYTALSWLVHLLGVREILLTDSESGLLTAPPWKRSVLRFRTRVLTKPVARMIGISHFVKQRLTELGVPGPKLSVVHNAVDADRFRPGPEVRAQWVKALAIDPSDVILATVSTLLPFKNTSVLIDALAVLVERGIRARLLVAGDGPLRSHLVNQSRALNVADRVHWLGYVEDPATLLQGCDVFLLASLGEAFGNVLAEAMACGIPVVGSHSGGIPEVVVDGDTGFLVPPRSAVAFADAIQRLALSPELRERMGRAGRERVRVHFGLDGFVARTLAVYDLVWNRSTAGSPDAESAGNK